MPPASGEAPAYTAGTGVGLRALAITESGAGIADALATIEAVENTGINQASGGHLAYIPGGGLFPAALGDLLADVGNRYVGIRFAAPAAAQMERSLVEWMGGLVGYPATAGVLKAIGLGLIAYMVVSAATDLSGFLARKNGEDFLTAPALTLALVPFLFLVAWASRREQANLRKRWQAASESPV
jgi:hypothetical protein